MVICTYNGEKRLPNTLNALKNQEFSENIEWELILVDNASKDHTQKISREIWGDHPVPLIILYEPIPGRDSALKTGLANVTYKYVINVDDDNWLERDYLAIAFNIMESDESIAILGGMGIAAFEVPIPKELIPFEGALAIHPQQKDEGYLIDRHHLYGAGFVIRKRAYDELFANGFRFFLTGRSGKELFSGEDQELGMAMKMFGYKLYYSDRLKFTHEISKNRLTVEYFAHLYKAFGKSEFVLDQYRYFGNFHKNAGYKYSSKYYLTYLFYITYLLIRLQLAYWFNYPNTGKRIRNHLESKRKRALFLFTIKNPGLFFRLKRYFRQADWVRIKKSSPGD